MRHARAFVTVARLGSFTDAAKALRLSQPTLTVQIRQLEEAVKARLLDRDTHALSLTAIGREYLPSFMRLLADFDALGNSISTKNRGDSGTITVSCLPSVSSTILPEAAAKVSRSYPRITIAVRDAISETIIASVLKESVDFGIGTRANDVPGLAFEPLFMDGMLLAYARRHAFAREKRLSTELLMRYPLILTDTGSSIRKLIDRAFSADGLLPNPAYEVTYLTTALAFARAGLGVAILPTSTLGDVRHLGLASRPVPELGLTREIGVIMRDKRSLSSAALRLVDTLREITKRGSDSMKV
jgi:LysR family carnitine catabolism transcriptional activator